MKRSFDELINKTESCWLWLGSITPNGYGNFYVGIIDGKAIHRSAHRFSWERASGRKLLPNEFVCHHCDSRRCVRPDHLFVGNQSDNIKDAVSKGRFNQGFSKDQNHIWAKLKDIDIPVIRQLLADGISQTNIAKTFGVNPCQINRIKHSRRWRSIPK